MSKLRVYNALITLLVIIGIGCLVFAGIAYGYEQGAAEADHMFEMLRMQQGVCRWMT